MNISCSTLFFSLAAFTTLFAACNNSDHQSVTWKAETKPQAPRTKWNERQFPNVVHANDIMTNNDLLFIRDMKIATADEEMSKWPIIRDLRRLSIEIVDSDILAEHISNSFPIKHQPAFEDVSKMIEECAKILDVDVPTVMVQQNPVANAYVTKLENPILVLTSGLLEVFKEHPEELRFVIGHELGHIKCDHVKAHTIGRIVMGLVMKGESGDVASHVVTPFLVCRLFEWVRQSELSADRAGMVCVGFSKNEKDFALKTSQQALTRLLHGTGRSIKTMTYMEEVVKLEQGEPFVEFRSKVQSMRASHPMVATRCRELAKWSTSKAYYSLLTREDVQPKQKLLISSLCIAGLPSTDFGEGNCDPVLSIFCEGKERETNTLKDNPNPKFRNLNWSFEYHSNARVVVNIYDCDGILGRQSIGSAVIEIAPSKNQVSKIVQIADERQCKVEIAYEIVN